MKQAMVFAAGLGTRLKPLTDTMPKALVRVGGRPLLEHVVLKLKEAGFERIIVNVHHFAGQIIDFLAANHNFDIDIRVSDEREQLLETGGAIKRARRLFDNGSPVLIHNVDILSNADLSQVYAAANDADALLLVSERQTTRYLLFDGEHPMPRLVGWKNITTGEVRGQEGHPLAFSGIHVVSPSLFPLMDNYPDRFPVVSFYLDACTRYRLAGFRQDNLRLLDVGKLDTLDAANQFIVSLTS